MDALECRLRRWTDVLRRAVACYSARFELDYNDAEDCLAAIEEAIAADPERFAHSLCGTGEEAALWRIAWYRVRKAAALRSRSRGETCFILEVDTGRGEHGDREVASPAPGPEDLFLAAERAAEIYAAVDSLPPSQRALWHRVEVDGDSIKDIAAESGRPYGRLRTDLWRIRKKLCFALRHLRE